MKIHNISDTSFNIREYRGQDSHLFHILLGKQPVQCEEDARYTWSFLNCPWWLQAYEAPETAGQLVNMKRAVRAWSHRECGNEKVRGIFTHDEGDNGFTYLDLIRLDMDDSHTKAEAERIFKMKHFKNDPYIYDNLCEKTIIYSVFLRNGEWYAYNFVEAFTGYGS